MIRIVKQKSTDMRCTLIQMVLLIAMMLCLAFPRSDEPVTETVGPFTAYESHQDIFTGYIFCENKFL